MSEITVSSKAWNIRAKKTEDIQVGWDSTGVYARFPNGEIIPLGMFVLIGSATSVIERLIVAIKAAAH
jgi:hypothetical protein